MTLAAIVSLVQLAVQAAPDVVTVYNDAKQLITALFTGGQITAAEQDALNAWATAHQAATLAGQEPPEFKVTP